MKYLSLRRRRYIEYEEKRKVEKGTADENSGPADPPHPALRLMVHVRPCFDSFITRPAPSPQVADLVCSKSCVSGGVSAAVSSLQCLEDVWMCRVKARVSVPYWYIYVPWGRHLNSV